MSSSALPSFFHRHQYGWLMPAILLLLTGCKPQPQIARYTAPKPESIETPISRPARPEAPTPGPASSGGPGVDLKHETPDGWKEKKAGPFALKSFEVTEGSDRLDITLSIAGGDMNQNMNRWRAQLGLAEVSSDEISAALKPREVNGLPAQFIEIHQPETASDRQTIMGVVILTGEQTWFIKLRGPTPLAEKQRESFEAFAKSVKW